MHIAKQKQIVEKTFFIGKKNVWNTWLSRLFREIYFLITSFVFCEAQSTRYVTEPDSKIIGSYTKASLSTI